MWSGQRERRCNESVAMVVADSGRLVGVELMTGPEMMSLSIPMTVPPSAAMARRHPASFVSIGCVVALGVT
jgi:hypothetical protein